MDLFHQDIKQKKVFVPLAERMRPDTLEGFFGQEHLVGEGKPLRLMIENNTPVSMIFWGPPGVGKTTLALIIANSVNANFVQISAVTAGVKDVREIIEKAKYNRNQAEGIRFYSLMKFTASIKRSRIRFCRA